MNRRDLIKMFATGSLVASMPDALKVISEAPAVESADGPSIMEELWGMLVKHYEIDGEVPKKLIVPARMFHQYEDALAVQVRYTDTKFANGGFKNLMFKNVPVVRGEV